jgi:hypothetical protein
LGGTGKVAFLVAGLVTEVSLCLAAVPGAFLGLDVVVAGMLIGVVTDSIEDEEFRLGSKVDGVRNAG